MSHQQSPLPNPPTAIATPGERWGGFIFIDPAAPVAYTVTPAASGPVPGAEGIPEGHPGFTRFADMHEAAQLLGPSAGLFTVGFTPPDYELAGGWAIVLEGKRVVDLSLSFRRRGSPLGVLSPALWIGWTDRAPQPLPASTAKNEQPTGAIGEPVVKLTVHGQPAVYQEWKNPSSFAPETKVLSSLNWFEAGRLWFVQADESLSTLAAVAESIAPYR